MCRAEREGSAHSLTHTLTQTQVQTHITRDLRCSVRKNGAKARGALQQIHRAYVAPTQLRIPRPHVFLIRTLNAISGTKSVTRYILATLLVTQAARGGFDSIFFPLL